MSFWILSRVIFNSILIFEARAKSWEVCRKAPHELILAVTVSITVEESFACRQEILALSLRLDRCWFLRSDVMSFFDKKCNLEYSVASVL